MSWIIDLAQRRDSRAAVAAICAENPSVRRVDKAVPSETGVAVISALSAQLAVTLADAAVCDSRLLVVLVGPGTVDPWALLSAGATDCVRWRGDTGVITSRLTRMEQVDAILDSETVTGSIVGKSPALRRALRDLVTAARYGTGPILILGETGTGKELVAHLAHHVTAADERGEFVVVDCTTIVPTLMGSELFGHERGAFTGAVAVRTGACSAADGGTLFLDEVGELPHELQPELMRVVQEGTYKRVGGDRWYRSRFRLICATNRDLRSEVAHNRFRADLYHRIASTTITLPPLRDRQQDLLALFKHFYAHAQRDPRAIELEPCVEEAIAGREYPGNLRDLRQLAYRVAARHVGPGPVTPGDLPVEDRPVSTMATAGVHSDVLAGDLTHAVKLAVAGGTSLKELKELVCDLAMTAALEASEGNVRAAAARLGVTDRALHLRRARNKPT